MAKKEESELNWPAISLGFGPVPTIYVPPSIGEAVPDVPAELKYSRDHVWARSDADTGRVRVGVTDFAQQSLGDVIAVNLPAPGDTVTAGDASGDIESVKSVNDLVTPVTGTVRARNDELTGAPDLINTDPYGRGWILEIDTDPATLGQQLTTLMDPAAYRELTGA
jgi:glycine cleavage system H protein